MHQCQLMEKHLLGTDGYQKSYDKALEYLQTAIEHGENCQHYYDLIVETKEYGHTPETKIFILETNNWDAVAKEYELLSRMHGERHVDWELIRQSATINNHSFLDKLEIQVAAETLVYYFDINRFMGD